jgi:hypothetical protein
MSNVNFNAVLFNNMNTKPNAPQLTGHVVVPVAQIDQLIELLKAQREFPDNGVQTVRLPLSLWTAQGKAPLALKGKASFYTPDTTAPAVDPTPAIA